MLDILGTCQSNAKNELFDAMCFFSIRSRECRWLVVWEVTENFHDGAR